MAVGGESLLNIDITFLKVHFLKYEKNVSILLLPHFKHFKCPIMQASNIYKQKMHLFSKNSLYIGYKIYLLPSSIHCCK